MFHNFIKIFTFIIFITSININLYAAEEVYKDGKEWKELNLGLIESSKDGNIEKIKELLNRGAIISTRNRFGNTALHYAARNNHIEIFNILLDAGADHDKPSLSNKTPFLEALMSGNKEIARGGRYDNLLKSLGAKKNIPAVGAAINLNNI